MWMLRHTKISIDKSIIKNRIEWIEENKAELANDGLKFVSKR